MARIKDLKIGAQLKIGLGIILVLVAILGMTALFQNENLWRQTVGLYEHPLQVRRATGDLRADILAIHQGVKDLCLTENESEVLPIIQSIDLNENNARRQFNILYSKYLGNSEDIKHLNEAFVRWRTSCDETIRLLREGKVSEAVSRTRTRGVQGVQLEKVISYLDVVEDFAESRAEQFYNDARDHKDGLMQRLGIMLGVIIIFSLGLGYLLLKGIMDPLQELTSVTQDYQHGDIEARCRYESKNEFGTLALSFNSMASAVQADIKSKLKIGHIADVMLREENLKVFCRELLKTLLEYTGSQIGAVHLMNEQKSSFEHFESIGLSEDCRRSFSASGCEGEFGSALTTRQIQRLVDIPADTFFTLITVTGDMRPKEIITIPIISGKDVTAMISLSSVRNYDEQSIQILNDIWDVMTARINGVLAFQQVIDLSIKLELQTRELESQKTELSLQADELKEQNVELEMQKRQLAEANNIKNSFISNMSHELRTPLNSVIALSSVLSRRLADIIPDEEHGYIEVIERNGRSLLSLINDILDLERIEAGHGELTISLFSVKHIVGEIVEMLEPQAREKNVALINSISDDIPLIASDRVKFCHILQNIIGNAVKFTEQGQVDVAAVQLSDNEIQIFVRDTGIGIREDRLDYIFDEFRQADESTSKRYGGTGLGLAIAKKYTNLLRGRIDVKSISAKGSTFTLTLPTHIEGPYLAETEDYGDKKALSDRPPIKPLSPVGHGRQILVVEDSAPAIIQIKDILIGQGYDVLVAHNGREALEHLEHDVPDAVILDLMMPEVDGFEVLERIRANEQTKDLPVLILTAKHVTAEELSSLKGNHIRQLIQKGDINRTDLLAAVAAMAKPYKPRKANFREQSPSRTSRDKPMVLVVEDNADNMLTVRAVLANYYQVIEAKDGKTAIDAAITHEPDLILMDISLPVMNGIRAFNAIREQEALSTVPVIALTASVMKGNREQVLAHGFDGYISKPIEPQGLLDTIRETLHGREHS